MQILGSLGIDTKLFFAQIVNFGLLLWLLTKFLYKPIINRIEKDETELKQAQIQNETLTKEKEEFEQQKRNETTKQKQQSQIIIQEAETIAKQIKKRAQIESTQEKQAVIKQIKDRLKEINNEKTIQQ